MMHERLSLALASIWFGVMGSFSLITAPSAFAVLPEQRLAGALVSRTLAITESTGMVIGLVLLTSILISSRTGKKIDRILLSTVLLMTAAMVVARFYVARSLHDIRLLVDGEIATLAADDPLRLKFNLLHRVSVWLMGIAMIGALVIITRGVRRR
ncbi:MAG: DUF4149 domain-containing protein [Acidobacteriota bacterium]